VVREIPPTARQDGNAENNPRNNIRPKILPRKLQSELDKFPTCRCELLDLSIPSQQGKGTTPEPMDENRSHQTYSKQAINQIPAAASVRQ
jgi:hypothetical protein